MNIFETRRLIVRKAKPCARDAEIFSTLWTDPTVMKFVGFPQGIAVTAEQVLQGIKKVEERDSSEYDKKLVIELKKTGALIGECKLGRPGEDGISQTDVKLLPRFWRHGFGKEVKQGLVDYLFTHTDCRGIKATPNRQNVASQKMQEHVGAERIGEEDFKATGKGGFTADVPAYIYVVSRETWNSRKGLG